MKALRSLLLTVTVFSFAGWAYIALNAVFHPESLSWQLTHLTPWIREDTFGILCFGTSFVSFFFWKLTSKEK